MIANKKLRSHKVETGQSLLEATFGLTVIVAIVIALVDLAIVIYGVSLNDFTCRNAARAAAAGNTGEAEYRARVAIDQSSTHGFANIISHPTLILPVEMNLTSQPIARRDPETDRFSNPGGLVTGTVTVTTQLEVRPLAMDFVFRRQAPLVFRSTQSFPIHYILPAS